MTYQNLVSHRRCWPWFMASLLFGFSLFAGLNGSAFARDYVIPETRDLYADARLAAEKNVPLLVMFAMEDCGYCEQVKQDFLIPMLRSGDYTDKVLMRIVRVDDYSYVKDFDGQERPGDSIATRFRAYVVPTVIFVDKDGKQLSPRLLGITTPDFYGGDLDNAINESLRKLRALAYAN